MKIETTVQLKRKLEIKTGNKVLWALSQGFIVPVILKWSYDSSNSNCYIFTDELHHSLKKQLDNAAIKC